MIFVSTLQVFVLLGALASPSAPPQDNVLPRAQRIEQRIDAGELELAQRELAEAKFPALVYATLAGRLALAKGDAKTAERQFARAMKLAPDHAPLRVLRAHAFLAAGAHRKVLEVLDHPKLNGVDPGIALLRAAAYEGTASPSQAYAALSGAAKADRGNAGLRRELVLLCARHGLYAAARSWAEQLSPQDLGRDAALLLLQELRGGRSALALAQWLAAGFPDDADVQAQLGWALSAGGMTRSAAAVFTRATTLGGDLAFAAAEHHRAAGRHRDALAVNARVVGNRRRAQQRFDILFEQGSMARAIAAGEALADKHGLSPRRRYNLAYAHYTLGQFAEASARARALTSTSEARRATKLLRAMGRAAQ